MSSLMSSIKKLFSYLESYLETLVTQQNLLKDTR